MSSALRSKNPALLAGAATRALGMLAAAPAAQAKITSNGVGPKGTRMQGTNFNSSDSEGADDTGRVPSTRRTGVCRQGAS